MRPLVFVLALLGLLVGPTWATDDCPSSFYECDNGECVFDPFNSDRCDNFRDCDDNSDEEGCVNILAIAVGVSVAGFVLLIVIPIAICGIIWCCVAGAASQSRRGVQTAYVGAAAPATTATVVSTTAGGYPAGGYNYPKPEAPPPYPGGYPAQLPPTQATYPPQPQPQPGYPPQSQPQTGYPPQPQPQTGYPPQSQPQPGYPQSGYPAQPDYPPQEGYPLQETAAGYPNEPPPGYPSKDAWGSPPQGGYPPQQ